MAASGCACAAEVYPSKPIRIIIATTVGSGPDILARQIGAKLTESWGQQIVIDPRAGASGMIGAELTANAAPDGYTLWMATMSHVIATTMYNRLLLARDFAPVTQIASTPYVIAVNTAVPANSIAELIALAKSRPGQLLYGSAGQGSTPHLCIELFKSMTATDLVHVPYRGAAPALTDLMAGHVQLSCVAAPAVQSFARSGKVTPFMLPPFSAVAERIYADAIAGDLWRNLAVTLFRALTGFAIAAVGGVALGAMMARSRIVRWFFDPIISVGFPMPKIAFLPVVILWLGVYDTSKITIIVVDAIFPVIAATVIAIQGVEKELIWSARNMGANDRELMWQVVLPAALPQILTGLQVALPISMIVAVVAEMLMGGYGLGGAMMVVAAVWFALG